VRPGDVLTLPLPRGVRVIRVLAISERRGSAAAAQGLYEELAEG
jgi:ribosome-associated heat shock protein Hsp15